MKSMKILLVNKFHYFRGGAERAYFDTARVLRNAGHEVAFFSMQHKENLPSEWESFFVENVDYHNQYSISRKIRLALKILWNFEARKKLESLLEVFQPDVVHLHNIYHQISPSIIQVLKKRRIPTVMTLHDYKLVCPNYSLFVKGKIWEGGAFQCIKDLCVRDSYGPSIVCSLEHILHTYFRVYENVGAFLSPSQFLIDKYAQRGFSKEIFLISQPIERNEVFSLKKHTNFHLLFSGRLSQEKGIDVLLRAMVSLPNVKLHIAGDGPQRVSLESLTDRLNIRERVSFLGHLAQADLNREMDDAKVVVLPSVWYENMPYSLTEALGKGKVVVASKIGGITERISDGKNGFLFEAGNDRHLSQILRTVLERDDLQDIAKNAFESVGDLNEDIYRKQLEEVYSKVMHI